MDRQGYELRPFADADYVAVARINSLIMPTLPESAEEIRRWDALITRSPGRTVWRRVAVDRRSGVTVGWAGLSHTMWNYHPRKFFARVAVDPDHRGRGVGQELYALLAAHAAEQRAIALWASVSADDPVSVRYLEDRGFVPMRKTWFSRLTLSDPDPAAIPDRSGALAEKGFRFTTIAAEGADRPEVRRRLYELGRVTGADVPRLGDYTPATFDEFVESEFSTARIIPEAIFVACRAEEYIGWTSLQRVPELADTLDIGFTGTLPGYRGLGIATELKRRAVQYARAHGYRSITTANDSLNPRIWAINKKLGFRQEQILIQAEKTLPPPTA